MSEPMLDMVAFGILSLGICCMLILGLILLTSPIWGYFLFRKYKKKQPTEQDDMFDGTVIDVDDTSINIDETAINIDGKSIDIVVPKLNKTDKEPSLN